MKARETQRVGRDIGKEIAIAKEVEREQSRAESETWREQRDKSAIDILSGRADESTSKQVGRQTDDVEMRGEAQQLARRATETFVRAGGSPARRFLASLPPRRGGCERSSKLEPAGGPKAMQARPLTCFEAMSDLRHWATSREELIDDGDIASHFRFTCDL